MGNNLEEQCKSCIRNKDNELFYPYCDFIEDGKCVNYISEKEKKVDKVYIVFGSWHDCWEWDRVYADRKRAQKRADTLNENIPSMKEAEKLGVDPICEYVEYIEPIAEKYGHDSIVGNMTWRVVEKEVKK